jgi:hypothetical protein
MSNITAIVLYGPPLSNQGRKRLGRAWGLPVDTHSSSLFCRLAWLGKNRRKKTESRPHLTLEST